MRKSLLFRTQQHLLTLLHSRGLHSAVFSLIGASGFLASAVLPAHAYPVSIFQPASSYPQNVNHTYRLATAVSLSQPPVRLPASHRSSGGFRRTCTRPPPWDRHCHERVIRRAWSNHRSLDLQSESGGEGIPYRPCYQRRDVDLCLRGLRELGDVLSPHQREDRPVWQWREAL